MNKLSDLRFVIGLFFLIVGLLLFVYGWIKNSTLNLYCGIGFIAFALFMLFMRTKSNYQ